MTKTHGYTDEQIARIEKKLPGIGTALRWRKYHKEHAEEIEKENLTRIHGEMLQVRSQCRWCKRMGNVLAGGICDACYDKGT